jgi:hypothetical protein
MVRLQTLDLRIGVRVPTSQPTNQLLGMLSEQRVAGRLRSVSSAEGYRTASGKD